MLETFTVLTFTYLLFSLLVSTIQETLASIGSCRGKTMEQAVKAMLGCKQNGGKKDRSFTIWDAFEKHHLYDQLRPKQLWVVRKPSYLTSTQFSRIITDLLQKEEVLGHEKTPDQFIASYFKENENCDLKKTLLSLYREGLDEWHTTNIKESKIAAPTLHQKRMVFKEKLEEWFDEMMDRTIGWYKRKVQTSLIVLGILLAFILDADTFEMYRNLSKNTESRRALVATIDQIVENQDSIETLIDTTIAKQLMNEQLVAARNALGFRDCSCYFNSNSEANTRTKQQGISKASPTKEEKEQCFKTLDSCGEVIFKLLGWLVTALAISLGAPFWFDLLKRVISIRNAGKVPRKKKKSATKESQAANITIQNNTEEIIG